MDPERLVFATSTLERVRELSAQSRSILGSAAGQAAQALFQEQPFYHPPDMASKLLKIIDQAGLSRALCLRDEPA